MLRLCCLILAPVALTAAIWQPTFQEFTRTGDVRPAPLEGSREVWSEAGFVEGESADYIDSRRAFSVTAWKFKDATGAIAAWHWLRPPEATPSKALRYAADIPKGTIAVLGNYVLRIDGYRPKAAELKLILGELPGLVQGPQPFLPGYVPSSVTFHSTRYIIGKKSVSSFAGDLPAGLFDPELGMEVMVGDAPGGNRLAILRYPTPQIARLRAAQASALGERAIVKRSGPLVVVAYRPDGTTVNSASARPIVDSVEFQADVIANEANPFQPVKQAADMLLSIFVLTGGLLGVCLAGGLIFGAMRILRRRGPGGESIQTLRLD
jgi:hypothetical protein